MEPQIIDFYYETPSCFRTIDKLNNEYNLLYENYNIIKNENEILKKKIENYESIIAVIYHLKKKNNYNKFFN